MSHSPPPIHLGDIALHRVIESQLPLFPARVFFPGLTKELLDENRSWLEPRFIEPVTEKVILAMQSYVIKTPHHTILVDSCVGNHKPRPGRPFWDQQTSDTYARNLAAAGIAFEDVDFVMCTHLHVDHVGWNTKLENGRWVPTFPNARYLFSERELAFWTERESNDPAGRAGGGTEGVARPRVCWLQPDPAAQGNGDASRRPAGCGGAADRCHQLRDGGERRIAVGEQ